MRNISDKLMCAIDNYYGTVCIYNGHIDTRSRYERYLSRWQMLLQYPRWRRNGDASIAMSVLEQIIRLLQVEKGCQCYLLYRCVLNLLRGIYTYANAYVYAYAYTYIYTYTYTYIYMYFILYFNIEMAQKIDIFLRGRQGRVYPT